VRLLAGLATGLGPGDLVGAEERVVDAPDHLGNRVGRVEALVGVGFRGQVGVGGNLPARQVDGGQAGPDLLDRLVAGQRAERVNEVHLVEQLPQPLGTQPGEGVLFLYRAAQPHHIECGVGAPDRAPPRAGRPLLAQPRCLLGG
jgi:hypothetical protein